METRETRLFRMLTEEICPNNPEKRMKALQKIAGAWFTSANFWHGPFNTACIFMLAASGASGRTPKSFGWFHPQAGLAGELGIDRETINLGVFVWDDISPIARLALRLRLRAHLKALQAKTPCVLAPAAPVAS